MNLDSLLPMLKQNGVTRFKGYGIEVDLGFTQHAIGQSTPFVQNLASVVGPGIQTAAPEPTMDLPGTNEAMSHDQILNWSASPDLEGKEPPALPLTGEGAQ